MIEVLAMTYVTLNMIYLPTKFYLVMHLFLYVNQVRERENKTVCTVRKKKESTFSNYVRAFWRFSPSLFSSSEQNQTKAMEDERTNMRKITLKRFIFIREKAY